jgi:hypothetical protein
VAASASADSKALLNKVVALASADNKVVGNKAAA